MSIDNDRITNHIQFRRDNSLLEYILNHRYDILDKIKKERTENRRYIMVEETEIGRINISPILNNNEIINNANDTYKIHSDKNKYYYKLIICYFIFLLHGFIGGILINLISNYDIVNFDMLFNTIISPIIYYHSPRNILMNLHKNEIMKFYMIPFIIGLNFRFLDKIPGFSQFILDPYYIKTPLQIGLLIVVISIILLLSIYYIYISSNPILNTMLFVTEIAFTLISSYFYLLNSGNIHIHHYFIGLILMLVSKNYHSKIVVITHAISYAIYIDGISAYGFDTIFWKS